jgi:hypothetical protein
MKIKALLDHWTQTRVPAKTATDYAVRLPIDDAARLHALADLYPGVTMEQLITDLLSSGLQELEGALPYEPGTKVISRDEQGDPIYEDIGPTPKYLTLTRKYREQLSAR